MIEHLRTIAWLKYRLIKNSTSRNLRWLGAFAWGLQLFLSAIGTIVLSAIAFGAGFVTVDEESVWVLLAILDGGVLLVLLVSATMLLGELNEADFIDTGKLLFLPIRLRTLFGINFVVRNATGITLIVVPPLIAICTSLAIIHGFRMLLGIPLGLITLLVIIAWYGFIREWLLALGENLKRSLLTASLLLFAGIIGVVGLGGAYAAILAEREAPIGVSQEKLAALANDVELEAVDGKTAERLFRETLLKGNVWIPLGWFPLGMYRMIDHQYQVALFGGLGLAFIAALGIASEYRLVLRRYKTANSGADTSKKTKSIPKSKWTRLAFPYFAHEWSAYAGLAFLVRTRSFTFKSSHWFYACIALAGTIIAVITNPSSMQGRWWADLVPFAIAAMIIFFSGAMSTNVFGQDRTGFQVLVLMPVKRHTYIICKNVILIAFILAWFAMLMVPCILVFRPHPIAVIAGFFVCLQAQLVLTVIGNGLSIALPFRLKEGALEQPAQPMAVVLPSFLLMLSLPLVFGPTVITAIFDPLFSWLWEMEGAWISLASALTFLAATLCVYAASIPVATTVLANREMKILELLASDRE